MTRHLIHIGYPKAASTYLQEWFARHPQTGFAVGAIGGFRDVFDMARTASRADRPDIRCYVTSFEGLVDPKASAGHYPVEYGLNDLTGEIPLTEARERMCELLRDVFGKCRILIVTRGFRSMLMSGYSQYVRCGGRMIVGDFCDEVVRSGAFGHYDYGRGIGQYRRVFGKDNVLVLPFELLLEDQERFLGLIEKELGLDHHPLEIGRVNESLTPEELYWYPRISNRVARLTLRAGRRRFGKFYAWYIHQTIRNKLRLPVRLLSRLRPGGRVTAEDLPDDVFERFAGFAEILREEPLYRPYLAEYFLDR